LTDERISKQDLHFAMASMVSRRSTCPRAEVGAVITRDDHVVSVGYNGAPPGAPHCTDVGCDPPVGCQRTLHAEANAVAWAARYGIATEGCSLWCTLMPCVPCAKLMLSAGIIRFGYIDDYRDETGLELLRDQGVEIVPAHEEHRSYSSPVSEPVADGGPCRVCGAPLVRRVGVSLACEHGHYEPDPSQPAQGIDHGGRSFA
jgi:dCMP deaminase